MGRARAQAISAGLVFGDQHRHRGITQFTQGVIIGAHLTTRDDRQLSLRVTATSCLECPSGYSLLDIQLALAFRQYSP